MDSKTDLQDTERGVEPPTAWRLPGRLGAASRWARERVSSRWARTLLVMALVAMVVAILAWSVYRNWDTLATYDWQFDPRYLGISFLCYSAALSLSVFTWHTMMGSLAGFANLRLNAKYYLYSAVAKRLPGFVWYVGSRILLYEQEGIRKSHTSVGIVLESAMMILSGMLIYLGSMLFSQQDWLQGKLPWLLLAMVPVVVAILKPALMIRFLNAVLARFGRSPLSVQIGWRESTRWVAQYCANWIAGGLTLYYLAWAIQPLPLSAMPDVVGIVALTGVLRLITFFIPGGWGIQEVSLSLGLNPYLPLPIAIGIPLLFRLWLILSELLWVAAGTLVL